MSSESSSQITWENLQKEADGKFSIQMKDGEELLVQTTGDGKMEVVGVDGKLMFFNWIGPVNPNDPDVIAVAKDAAKKNNVEFESVICGVYIKPLIITAYGLVIIGKDIKGVKNIYFTATVGSFVLLFQYVIPSPF